jgi:hypothetical protein
VVVTATSSNASVIQNADITLGGSGTNRSVTARAGGTTGAATITITARDSIGLTDVETFRVTVGSGAAGNQPPNIVGIGQRQLATNSTTGSIPFTVKDEDPSGVRITVVSSSNSAIVNRSDVTIAGIEENRTFSAKSGNTTGRVVITLRATDAQGLSGQQTVVLNVVRPVVTNPTATATPQPTATATATEPPATPTPIFGGPVLTTTPGAGPPPDGDDGGLGGGTLLLLLLLLLAVLGTVGILVFAMRRSREGDEEERSTEIGEALPTPAVATTGTSATRGGDRRDEQETAPVAAGTSSNDGGDERNPASSEAPAEVASGTGTTMTADQTPVPQQPSAAPPVPQVPAPPAPQQPAPQAPPTADMQPLAPQVGNGLTPQAPPAPQPTLPPAAGVYQAPQQQPVYQPQQQQPVYQPQQPQQPPVAYVPNGNGGQPAYQPQQPDVQQQPAYQPLPQPAYQPGQQPSMYQPQPQAAYQQQPVYQQPQPMHQAPDAYQQPQPAYPQPAPEQQAAYPPPYVPGQYPPEQFAGGYPPAAQQPAGYAPPPTAYQQPGPAPQPVAPQPPAPPADQAEPQPPRQPKRRSTDSGAPRRREAPLSRASRSNRAGSGGCGSHQRRRSPRPPSSAPSGPSIAARRVGASPPRGPVLEAGRPQRQCVGRAFLGGGVALAATAAPANTAQAASHRRASGSASDRRARSSYPLTRQDASRTAVP